MKALILDDEEYGAKNLQLLVEKFCNNIHSCFVTTNPIDARAILDSQAIDVLFLDINMPEMNGFDFLELAHQKPISVIFVTAFEEFALKALKVGAVDYLLKPISVVDLIKAVEKVEQRTTKIASDKKTKLTLNHSKGIEIIDIDDISYLEAYDNLTKLYTNTDTPLVISKTMSEFEKILESHNFFRVHKSFIVNLDQIQRIETSLGYEILLKNKKKVPVSRRSIKEFQEILQRKMLQLKK
jgi:two-component system LytT family response regulator